MNETIVQSGSAICPDDDHMGYPRVCAHRGFNAVAPENSMPAYGAAIALGAEEIEFDLWTSKDGVLVSCHDETLERVSNGTGNVADYTYEELLKFDFGTKEGGEEFIGVRIPTFEEILQKFACQTIMNIHVKIWDCADRERLKEKEDENLEKIVALVRKYGAEKHVYFMTNHDRMLQKAKALAPDIKICVGQIYCTSEPQKIVDRAIAFGAEKVQFLDGYYFDETDVQKAHAHGIRCNYCAADDGESAKKFLKMGIDTIMTNRFQTVAFAVKEYQKGNA